MNPIQTFLKQLTTNAQREVTDQIGQIQNSPLAALNPMHFQPDQFMPRVLQQDPYHQQHPYKPIVMAGGEMEMTPGAGLGKAAVEGAAESAAKGGSTKFNPTDQPATRPQPAKPNVFQKAAMAANQTNKVKLPSSISGAADEARIQNTLNTVVPGNSLAEKYANLQPTMENLGNQIQGHLQQNPKMIPTDAIRQALMNKMKPLTLDGTLSQAEASQEVESYIGRMYDAAMGKNGYPAVQNTLNPDGTISTPGPLQMPDTIDSPTVYQMKKLGNDAIGNLFDNTGNVKPNLSPSQATTLALRNGLDNVISAAHPEIKDLTMTQSDLYRAAGPGNLGGLRGLDKGVAVGLPLKIGNIPASIEYNGPGVGMGRQVVSGVMNAAGDHPVAGGAILGAGGLIAGKKLYDAGSDVVASIQGKSNGLNTPPNNINPNGQQNVGNNQGDNHTYTSDSIPQSVNDIKPDQNGNYQAMNPYNVVGSDNKPIALSPQQYQQQKGQLLQQKAGEQYNTDYRYKQNVDQQIADLDNRYQTSSGLGKTYESAYQLNSKMQDARQILKNAPPNLMSLYPTYDALRQANDPNYKRLAEDLKYVEDTYPGARGLLFTPQTSGVAMAALDQVNRNMLNDYYSNLLQYTGGPSTGLPAAGATGLQPMPTRTPASTPGGAPGGSPAGAGWYQALPANPVGQLDPLP